MAGNPQCTPCRLIAGGDKRLEKRINQCKMWVPGGESLLSIKNEYAGVFSYKSLHNHAKKHQAPTKHKLVKARQAFETKRIYNEITTQGAERAIAVYTGHAEARKDLLQKGLEALERGDIQMTMNAMVSLLGQEQKAEENAKDRNLEMMKMFNYFASGSGTGRTDEPEEGQVVA